MHLQVEEYAVLGFGGGGPYALACARYLPMAQLKQVAVVAGIGNLGRGGGTDVPQRTGPLWRSLGLHRGNEVEKSFERRTVLRKLIGSRARRAAQKADRSALPRYLDDKMQWLLKHRSRQMLEDQTQFDGFVEALRHSFDQGGEANKLDRAMVKGPWGFELEEIVSHPIKLVYGTLDTTAPVGVGTKLYKLIHNARIETIPLVGHWSIIRSCARRVLEDLVSDWDACAM